MRTRIAIAALISLPTSAVLFGIGAATVLSIPALSVDAAFWLPIVIGTSFLLAPIISWVLAPRLRSRWQRQHPTPAET